MDALAAISAVPTVNIKELDVSVPTLLKSVNVSKLLCVNQLNGAREAEIKIMKMNDHTEMIY